MSKHQFINFARLYKALGYSWKGFRIAWAGEEAFRLEVLLCLLLLPLALWIGETSTERVLLILTVLLVPLIELLNTAIEAVVDRFGDEIHPLSGNAKDMGSAAVFVSVVIVVVVWASIILF